MKAAPLREIETKTTSCALWLEQHKLGATSWKAAKALGVLVIWSWPSPSKGPSQQRPTASWAALDRVLPAGWGRWSFPSAQHWWDPSGVLGTGLNPSGQETRGHTGANPANGHEDDKHLMYEKRLRELGLFSLKRRLRRTLSMYTNAFLFLFETFSCFLKCKLYLCYNFHINKSLLNDPNSII